MRILIVARCKDGHYAPFITEQVNALEKMGEECQFFGIHKNGFWGYLKQYPELRKYIRVFRPDIVHAHYGLCGVLANLQRKVPVVTTYHGSDINSPEVRQLSRFAICHSSFNIFVSQANIDKAHPKKNYELIPCGINLDDYPLVEKGYARKEMGLPSNGKFVLFAGSFSNPVKNAQLAKAAVGLLPGVELIELKGYSRHQVAMLMQAADTFLLTSLSEGSPQVIKEALTCGCPIVSVDVGDVRERVSGIEGCFLVSADARSIAEAIQKSFSFQGKTKGREAVLRDGLTNTQIANKVQRVYNSILNLYFST